MTDEQPAAFGLAALVLCARPDAPGMAETLLSLAAQTNPDFEIHLVVADGTSPELTALVELVGTFGPVFAGRVNVIGPAQVGSETSFGAGVAHTTASYVAALYPDDVVFAHWAETIALHGRLAGGRALSSPVAVQAVDEVVRGHDRIVTTVARPKVPDPVAFDLMDHLTSSPLSLRGLVLPRLTAQRVLVHGVPQVGEGWALWLAVALSCGTVDLGEVIHLERRLRSAASPPVGPAEWERERHGALEALGRSGLTFSPFFFESLSSPRHASAHRLEAEVERLRAQLRQSEASASAYAEAERAARAHVAALLSSASWRATAPLRMLGDAARRRRGTGSSP
jgi:hypothetical protein